MRVSRGWGLGTKALPRPYAPRGFWLCTGVKDCPSLPRPLLPSFCSFFLAVNYAKGGGKGRVGGGKPGGSLKDWGTGPVRKEPSQSPSALLPALSHGVLEKKGAGWPDWLARPWGQWRGGPAQLGEPLGSTPLPVPPSPWPWAGNVLFPPLPPRGQRAGRAGRRPTLFSSPPPPAQVRAGAAATAAAPDSRRPRAGAARGVGQGEGLEEPCGERASRRHLAAMPWAASAPRGHWSELSSRSSPTPPGERRPLAKAVGTELLAGPQGKGLRTCGKVIPFPDPCQPGFLSGGGE
ncbi:SKI family transcriptional corepressor 1-like [Sapajus apella]|uniref:SKI family transcriptional corepressor 1-like n=1 Tax=Sapajus apella TaxID=9515 RepID=A0A6J3GSK3_SAPAP|nr:SKI family transcriptional corepressor 1-like [Sapajus apella]